MAVAERIDPYLAFQFAVEIDQQIVAGFSEVSGIDFETEVETFREGGEHLHQRQLAGPTKFPSKLVLKRGLTDTDVLWSWYQDISRGRVTRKDVSILLLDAIGEEQWRWSFRNAVPVKWTGPQLRASKAEVAVETLELVHMGLIQR